MARTTSSSATEVITDSRESPLLLRGFRTGSIGRPPSRHERSLRNGNVRYRILKWIVLSISSTFLIAGSIGVGVTLWALSNTNFLVIVKSSSAGVYLLIASIILLFLAGAVGIVGILRKSQPVLGSFIVLLLLSLVFSLLGGIWTYVTATQSDQMSLQRVTNIVRYDYGRDTSKTAILDIVQQSFQCCGSGSFSSWGTSAYSLSQTEFNGVHNNPGTSFTVPKSCCIDPASQDCQVHRRMAANATTNRFIFTSGCVQKLKASYVPYGSYAIGASLAFVFLQIVGLLASFLLYRTINYYFDSNSS